VIAEAIDAAVTLGWALAVWIVLTAAAGTLGLWAVAETAAAAYRSVRRAVAASLAAVERLKAPELLPTSPGPSQARSGRSAPTWAQPDKDAA
jgi:hypothetical protein